jgi:hypothetical protein
MLLGRNKRTAAYLKPNTLPTLDVKLRHQSAAPDHKDRVDEFGFIVAKEESYRIPSFDINGN